MQRQFYSPTKGEYNPNVRPIRQGGTSAKTALQAAINLGGLTYGSDDPESYMTLNSQGKLPVAKFGNLQMSGLSVKGPLEVAKGKTYIYTITDYDYTLPYIITAGKGTVAASGETITYTAPATAGGDFISINERRVYLSVGEPKPETPYVITPTPGSYVFGSFALFTSSVFSMGDPNITDPHIYSIWELSELEDFSSIAFTTNLASNKTVWQVNNLIAGHSYYVRVKHASASYGLSNWSPVTKISVLQNLIVTGEETLQPGPTTGQQARLVPNYIRANDQFGYSVSISNDGNTVVVGEPYGDDSAIKTETGKAFIFTRILTGWSQKAVLSDPLLFTGAMFGQSVAMSGDGETCAVGCPVDKNSFGQTGAGSVYVFVLDKTSGLWTKQTRLLPVDINALNANSGVSVALSDDGNILAVGSNYNNWAGVGAVGTVSIYERTGTSWVLKDTLHPNTFVASLYFGTSVALSSDGAVVAVGANNDTQTAGTNGAVYIFTRAGDLWSQTTKLVNTVSGTSEQFGERVALSGDGKTCVVGAKNFLNTAQNQHNGAVYVFYNNAGTWVKERIVDDVPTANDYFGSSVAISKDGTKLVIGVPGKESNGLTDTGVVYVYSGANGAGWVRTKTISPKFLETSDRLGYSVGISGDATTTVVGSPGQYVSAGSIYIYV